MNYDEYQAESPIEKRGNILCVNPNGVDVVAKTVVEGSFQFVCQKCGQPLDRWYNGHWVPKFPDRTKGGLGTRGYMISQLNAVWVSADALKRKELESISKQAFYNYTLGYPYEDTKLKINENDIYDNRRSYLPKPLYNRGDYAFISVGIDWGNIHWVTVHGVKPDGTVDLIRLFNIVKPDSTDPKTVGLDVEKIILELTPYNPDIIVADIGDSGDKVARLIDHFGVGVVFGCKYPSTPRSTGQVKPTWNVQGNMVSADKLTQNKRYIAKIKEGRIGFYQDKDRELQLYANHWKNVVIRDEEDDKNEGQFYQTITRRGDDHYSQASVYGMLGYERLLDEHFGVDAYGLDTQWINDHVATPTDIYNQY